MFHLKSIAAKVSVLQPLASSLVSNVRGDILEFHPKRGNVPFDMQAANKARDLGRLSKEEYASMNWENMFTVRKEGEEKDKRTEEESSSNERSVIEIIEKFTRKPKKLRKIDGIKEESENSPNLDGEFEVKNLLIKNSSVDKICNEQDNVQTADGNPTILEKESTGLKCESITGFESNTLECIGEADGTLSDQYLINQTLNVSPSPDKLQERDTINQYKNIEPKIKSWFKKLEIADPIEMANDIRKQSPTNYETNLISKTGINVKAGNLLVTAIAMLKTLQISAPVALAKVVSSKFLEIKITHDKAGIPNIETCRNIESAVEPMEVSVSPVSDEIPALPSDSATPGIIKNNDLAETPGIQLLSEDDSDESLASIEDQNIPIESPNNVHAHEPPADVDNLEELLYFPTVKRKLSLCPEQEFFEPDISTPTASNKIASDDDSPKTKRKLCEVGVSAEEEIKRRKINNSLKVVDRLVSLIPVLMGAEPHRLTTQHAKKKSAVNVHPANKRRIKLRRTLSSGQQESIAGGIENDKSIEKQENNEVVHETPKEVTNKKVKKCRVKKSRETLLNFEFELYNLHKYHVWGKDTLHNLFIPGFSANFLEHVKQRRYVSPLQNKHLFTDKWIIFSYTIPFQLGIRQRYRTMFSTIEKQPKACTKKVVCKSSKSNRHLSVNNKLSLHTIDESKKSRSAEIRSFKLDQPGPSSAVYEESSEDDSDEEAEFADNSGQLIAKRVVKDMIRFLNASKVLEPLSKLENYFGIGLFNKCIPNSKSSGTTQIIDDFRKLNKGITEIDPANFDTLPHTANDDLLFFSEDKSFLHTFTKKLCSHVFELTGE